MNKTKAHLCSWCFYVLRYVYKQEAQSRSHGPLETPWKITLRHLADISCCGTQQTQLLEKKGTSPGLSTTWGNLHYRDHLVQEREWEAEGGKKGSFGCVFLIFASLAHIVRLCFFLAPPYLALLSPISLSSLFCPPLFPSG